MGSGDVRCVGTVARRNHLHVLPGERDANARVLQLGLQGCQLCVESIALGRGDRVRRADAGCGERDLLIERRDLLLERRDLRLQSLVEDVELVLGLLAEVGEVRVDMCVHGSRG